MLPQANCKQWTAFGTRLLAEQVYAGECGGACLDESAITHLLELQATDLATLSDCECDGPTDASNLQLPAPDMAYSATVWTDLRGGHTEHPMSWLHEMVQ